MPTNFPAAHRRLAQILYMERGDELERVILAGQWPRESTEQRQRWIAYAERVMAKLPDSQAVNPAPTPAVLAAIQHLADVARDNGGPDEGETLEEWVRGYAEHLQAEYGEPTPEPEPREFCMVCQQMGPVRFACAHPAAHLPLATKDQDANGEPVGAAVDSIVVICRHCRGIIETRMGLAPTWVHLATHRSMCDPDSPAFSKVAQP